MLIVSLEVIFNHRIRGEYISSVLFKIVDSDLGDLVGEQLTIEGEVTVTGGVPVALPHEGRCFLLQ